jgi:uncharacterized membrane protein
MRRLLAIALVLIAAGVAVALAVPVWFLGSYAHRAVLMREKK